MAHQGGREVRRLEQLLAQKAQSNEEETKQRQRLVDAEKAILTIAAELQEANVTIREQGQQIDELKKVAAKAKTDNMILQLHLEEKNKLHDRLRQEQEIWRRQSHDEWVKDTPPRPTASGPGFDFSPAAMMESPNTPSIPASPRPVEQVAHETPTKRLDMFGAGAMASPPPRYCWAAAGYCRRVRVSNTGTGNTGTIRA